MYESFFGIILFYCLCENKKPDLLVLQTIIRKRDVIIAEYQELFVDVTSQLQIPRIICRSLTNQNGDRTRSE